MSKMWNTLSDSRAEETDNTGEGEGGSSGGSGSWGGGIDKNGFDNNEFLEDDQVSGKSPVLRTRTSVLRRMSKILFPSSKTKTKNKDGLNEGTNSSGEKTSFDPSQILDDEAKDSGSGNNGNGNGKNGNSTDSGSDSVNSEYYAEMQRRKLEHKEQNPDMGKENHMGNYDPSLDNYWGHDHRDVEMTFKVSFIEFPSTSRYKIRIKF